MRLPTALWAGIYSSVSAGKPGELTEKRTVRDYEIEIPLENGGISYLDGVSAAIRPDTVICARPGQVRCTRLPLKTYYFHLTIEEEALRQMVSRLPPFVRVAEPERYRALFREIIACRETEKEEIRWLQQSLCLQLLCRLCRESRQQWDNPAGLPAHREAFEAAVRYVDGHLTQELSLETVAKQAGFSPCYFHKYFKAFAGVTLHRYVEEKRLEAAVKRLLETDETLTEIAYACGFSSQAYFSYLFKKKTGQTPREYARTVYRRYHGAADAEKTGEI